MRSTEELQHDIDEQYRIYVELLIEFSDFFFGFCLNRRNLLMERGLNLL